MKTPYRPFILCFKESDKVTAPHILWDHFSKGERNDLTEQRFYVVLDLVYGFPHWVNEHGVLGYQLEFIPKQKPA